MVVDLEVEVEVEVDLELELELEVEVEVGVDPHSNFLGVRRGWWYSHGFHLGSGGFSCPSPWLRRGCEVTTTRRNPRKPSKTHRSSQRFAGLFRHRCGPPVNNAEYGFI